MGSNWSAEQVLALAPDQASVSAGRRLATPAPWTSLGTRVAPAAVWGLCRGSGSKPYQTIIDLAGAQGPAYACSCPSRKFPCKHALGLLLIWSAGIVPERAEPADFAESWLAARAQRSAEKAAKDPAAAGDADPAEAALAAEAAAEAAAKRAQQRQERVASGLADLEQWLQDQARTGLAGADRAGYGPTDQVSARLVDAQAPGLAGRVRNLPMVAASGEGWPGRVLAELGLIHLLTVSHERLGELPAELASTVRSRIGYQVRTRDVLETPAVRDFWNVLSMEDDADDRLVTRRVQLHGSRTGRAAVVLSFSVGGQPLDTTLVPGTSIDADLHFYPAAAPSRAVVGQRHAEPGPLMHTGGLTIGEAVEAWSAALAADPWLTDLPLVLGNVVPVPPADEGDAGWHLADADPDHAAVRVRPAESLWTLLAISAGQPVSVAARYTPTGVRALAVRLDDRMVAL